LDLLHGRLADINHRLALQHGWRKGLMHGHRRPPPLRCPWLPTRVAPAA
jgi:hypothetical protein